MDDTDPLEGYDDCYAPGCPAAPALFNRRYKGEVIQVLPTCPEHATHHANLQPDRLRTFLAEQDATVVTELEGGSPIEPRGSPSGGT
ncbi:MAG: hypothetical protein ABEI31_00975 [Halodesulfurarchaeum sp.]